MTTLYRRLLAFGRTWPNLFGSTEYVTWLFHALVVCVMILIGAIWGLAFEFWILGVWGYFWRETEGPIYSGKVSLDDVMDVLVPLVLGGALVWVL